MKVSFVHKMREVIEACSPQTQRFGLLVYTLMTSENKPDDVDEFLRVVLALSQTQIDASRVEFNDKLVAWNRAHGVPGDALLS
jgi:hypothetical protein